jgi:hypothetical protein
LTLPEFFLERKETSEVMKDTLVNVKELDTSVSQTKPNVYYQSETDPTTNSDGESRPVLLL